MRFTQVNDYICNEFNMFYNQHEEIFNKNLNAHLIGLTYDVSDDYPNTSVIAVNKILRYILYPSIVCLMERISDSEEIAKLFIQSNFISGQEN